MNRKEIDYYPHVRIWFEKFLKSRFKNSRVEAFDTHSENLSSFLQKQKMHGYFPLFETYEIQVDITALIIKRKTAELAFVEFKTNYLCLKDIGQLLGYCRVALPKFAFLLSPKGPGRNLTKLIDTYGRTDILQYNSNDFIRLAKWNTSAGAIETLSVLPMGSHINIKDK